MNNPMNYPTAKILKDGTRIEYPAEFWKSPGVPIDNESVKVKTKPVPPFDAWIAAERGIPPSCGVYAIQILSRAGEYFTIYIGSSSCLAKRLKRHEAICEFDRVGIDYRVLLLITHDYVQVEERAIRQHQPALNTTHNKNADKQLVSLFFGRKRKSSLHG